MGPPADPPEPHPLRGRGGLRADRGHRRGSDGSGAADEALEEELGDVLLQVVPARAIAEQEGRFSIADVAADISDEDGPPPPARLRRGRRCPAPTRWPRTGRPSRRPRRASGGAVRTSSVDGVPGDLPALAYARELTAKAAKAGFDWDDARGTLDKVAEELDEVREAVRRPGCRRRRARRPAVRHRQPGPPPRRGPRGRAAPAPRPSSAGASRPARPWPPSGASTPAPPACPSSTPSGTRSRPPNRAADRPRPTPPHAWVAEHDSMCRRSRPKRPGGGPARIVLSVDPTQYRAVRGMSARQRREARSVATGSCCSSVPNSGQARRHVARAHSFGWTMCTKVGTAGPVGVGRARGSGRFSEPGWSGAGDRLRQRRDQERHLAADLANCAGDGLIVGKPGVKIDLNGHSITSRHGNTSASTVVPGSAGIRNPGFPRSVEDTPVHRPPDGGYAYVAGFETASCSPTPAATSS